MMAPQVPIANGTGGWDTLVGEILTAPGLSEKRPWSLLLLKVVKVQEQRPPAHGDGKRNQFQVQDPSPNVLPHLAQDSTPVSQMMKDSGYTPATVPLLSQIPRGGCSKPSFTERYSLLSSG